MKSSEVVRFNFLCGNAPSGDKEKLVEQICNQVERLVEEALELKEAALAGDWIKVADGAGDVLFVAPYLSTLAKAVGIDVDGAFEAICIDNTKKFTTSKELVEKWKDEKSQYEIDCYISEVEYEGVLHYCIRRTSDNKVLKYNDFGEVDLTPFVPEELLNKEK